MALKEDTLLNLFIIDVGKSGLTSAWAGRLNIVSPEQTGGVKVEYVNEAGAVVTYTPTPVAAAGFEISGSNKLPTPKIQFANIDGGATDLARDFDDLIGFKLIRIRTYAKYLKSIDGVDNSTYDAQAHFTPDTWWFQRKIEETKRGVTYELASVIDVEGMRLPNRRIYTNHCSFVYRGPECGYTGSQATCGKTLADCQARFGGLGQDLRFGGFPTTQNR